MKSISRFLMIYGIASAMTLSAEAQNRVTVMHNKYAHAGDSVYVDMTIDLNNADIPKNAYVLLTPVIKIDSMSKELPSLIINGKNRVTIYRRLVALNREPVGAGMVIHMGEPDMPQSYEYSAVIPYQSWMKDANFSIREDQCECNGPLVKMGYDLIVGRMQDINPLEPPKPPKPLKPLHLLASFREPDAEPIKVRSETGKAYLDFGIGSSVLKSDFMNNLAELERISEMIKKVKNDPAITITSITIEGYSSPDGSVASNLTLSGKRAAALSDYVSFVHNLDKSMFKVAEQGEDWATFEEHIIDSDIAYKEQILEIIRSTDHFDVREKKLKALHGGAPYKEILANIFPKLRRSDYRLEYTVIPFTIEEGKKTIESRPSLLSLNEMFLIAQSYPAGSMEYRRIFDIAAQTYPNNETANFNAAANALDVSDVNTARKYMMMVETQDAAYSNNLGVLTALQGDREQAAEHFRKAIEEGNAEAVKNLAEIEEV